MDGAPGPEDRPGGGRRALPRLIRDTGALVVLVLVVAAAFWGVGKVRSDGDGVEVAAEAPDATDGGSAPAPGDTTSPADSTPGDTPADAPADTPTDAPGDQPAEQATAPAPQPTHAHSDDEPATPDAPAQAFAPGDVSIQVLDAVLDDGGAAARKVADRVAGEGYNVVVVNKAALTYDVTTVLFTAGHEAEAKQVAAAFGFDAVREKPDNLSDSVDLHLVVGFDER